MCCHIDYEGQLADIDLKCICIDERGPIYGTIAKVVMLALIYTASAQSMCGRCRGRGRRCLPTGATLLT